MTTPTTAEQIGESPCVIGGASALSPMPALSDLLSLAEDLAARHEAGGTEEETHDAMVVRALGATIARLEGERDKAVEDLGDVVAGRVGVKEIMVRDGKMTMTMHTEMASILADSLAAMLDHGTAENYVEMDMRGSDGKRYTVIVRRAERPTPHELHMKAVAERDAERTRADAAERRVEALTSDVAVEAAAKATWELVRDAVWDDTTDEMKAMRRRESLVAIRAALAAASGDTAATEG